MLPVTSGMLAIEHQDVAEGLVFLGLQGMMDVELHLILTQVLHRKLTHLTSELYCGLPQRSQQQVKLQRVSNSMYCW